MGYVLVYCIGHIRLARGAFLRPEIEDATTFTAQGVYRQSHGNIKSGHPANKEACTWLTSHNFNLRNAIHQTANSCCLLSLNWNASALKLKPAHGIVRSMPTQSKHYVFYAPIKVASFISSQYKKLGGIERFT